MSILTGVTPTDTAEVRERVQRFQEAVGRIRQEVRKVIVGQDEVIEHVLIALFVGGHCLIDRLARHSQDAAGANTGADTRA